MSHGVSTPRVGTSTGAELSFDDPDPLSDKNGQGSVPGVISQAKRQWLFGSRYLNVGSRGRDLFWCSAAINDEKRCPSRTSRLPFLLSLLCSASLAKPPHSLDTSYTRSVSSHTRFTYIRLTHPQSFICTVITFFTTTGITRNLYHHPRLQVGQYQGNIKEQKTD